jgi:hypothetical protein
LTWLDPAIQQLSAKPLIIKASSLDSRLKGGYDNEGGPPPRFFHTLESGNDNKAVITFGRWH